MTLREYEKKMQVRIEKCQLSNGNDKTQVYLLVYTGTDVKNASMVLDQVVLDVCGNGPHYQYISKETSAIRIVVEDIDIMTQPREEY